MKDGIIIQARTGSTRLHNKILLPFYGGQRIIDILIGNIKQACAGKTIVLATTDRPQDDILAEVAREAGICCYRGDEDNVLDRFIRAAATFNLDRFIRSRRYTGKTVHRARYDLSLYTSRSVQRSPASVAR